MKLWKLDAIRGMAALYVAVGHTVESDLFLLKLGQEAVMVFFLLSGFVIEYSHHHSQDKSFQTYFKKRFIRIYSVLVPMFAVSAMISQTDLRNLEFWKTLAGNLLMLQDFATGKPHVIVPTLFASALWSLHYEWWFYMMYHPIVTHVQKQRQTVLVVVASIAAAAVYTQWPYAIQRLVMYFTIWWCGVDLARSYQKHGKVRLRDLRLPLIGVVVILAILAVPMGQLYRQSGGLKFGIHPVLEFRHFAAALFAVGVAWFWQAAGWRGIWVLKPGLIIAPISYSLYIAHQPMLAYATYLQFLDHPILEHAVYLALLLLFCWLTELRFFSVLKGLVRVRWRLDERGPV
jgi:peptidoglycan/LPS O-acetylase OafA/YrhL